MPTFGSAPGPPTDAGLDRAAGPGAGPPGSGGRRNGWAHDGRSVLGVGAGAAGRGAQDRDAGIAIGSGSQIALFVAPMPVLARLVLGLPMDVVFNAYELLALIAVPISVNGGRN